MRLDKQSLKFNILIGLLNVAIVVVAVGSSAGWWIRDKGGIVIQTVPSYVLAHKRATLIKQGKPVHITIPELAVDLPVREGFYNSEDGSWTLDESNTFFATPSSHVNNMSGTSLIYGHNTDTVFGKLRDVKSGVKVLVKTDTNLLFTYIYQSSVEVTPNDTSVFSWTAKPNLTLQTCSGDWDQLRAMHSFAFESVENV